MNESEVREAVEFIPEEKGDYAMVPIKYWDIVASLARAWLGRKMVDKKEYTHECGTNCMQGCDQGYIDGFNEAIDACRLASKVTVNPRVIAKEVIYALEKSREKRHEKNRRKVEN
jgi:hypothetical protein